MQNDEAKTLNRATPYFGHTPITASPCLRRATQSPDEADAKILTGSMENWRTPLRHRHITEPVQIKSCAHIPTMCYSYFHHLIVPAFYSRAIPSKQLRIRYSAFSGIDIRSNKETILTTTASSPFITNQTTAFQRTSTLLIKSNEI